MADNNTSSDSLEITFKVKTSGDSNHTITISEAASVLDLKTKLATEEYEKIPVERQRLIYSGRVMKNEEPLITYKIKTGNTVHMVKSAASNPTPAPASSSGSNATHQQVPSNMSAGTANNPLAGLTGARYAGLTGLPSRDMFGPDGGMVGNMVDDEQMANMLNNPMVVSQMNEMLNNDQFIDMMVNSSPMLRNNPNAREILRSPMFRQMMTNPDALRSAARMQRMMNGGGGASAFPAPGATDNTPSGATPIGETPAGDGGNAQSQQANPFGNMPAFSPEMLQSMQSMMGGGGAGGGANPFAMFGQPNNAQAGTQAASPAPQTGANTTSLATPSQGQGQGAPNTANQPANPFAGLFGGNLGAGAGGAGGNAAANPFGLPPMSPDAMQQMMQFMGINSPGGGAGGSPQPPDNRPPEERYAEQLRQLNDMGFYDFERNVAALRRTGGSVQGAIEHLLGGP